MLKALLKVFMVLCIFIAAFIWIGYAITDLTGNRKRVLDFTGINIESGEAIFWGKGRCYTCHGVGNRGGAIRCPNLGVKGDKFLLPIGQRAAERAKEREKETGKTYTAVDYLIESIARPDAYVVEGYKKEMPMVFEPPISLNLDEVRASIAYLLSQRYEALEDKALDEIIFPASKVGRKMIAEIEAVTTSGTQAIPFEPYIQGDPVEGERIFFDPDSNAPCGKCHSINGRGGRLGPDLSTVAAARTARFLIESMLEPNKVIANGYNAVLVVTKDLRYIAGIKKAETDTIIELVQANGELIKIYKEEINIIAPQKKSLMPDNFLELMNMKQFHDILAYLQTLRGDSKNFFK